MQAISSANQFGHLTSTGASLILFGGKHCGVCQAIKPKLEQLMAAQFPDMAVVYVDCELNRDICVQQGVFSLPVLKLFIDGQIHLEWVRNFSLREVTAQVERIYTLWQASR